jgi:hypothetical protein
MIYSQFRDTYASRSTAHAAISKSMRDTYLAAIAGGAAEDTALAAARSILGDAVAGDKKYPDPSKSGTYYVERCMRLPNKPGQRDQWVYERKTCKDRLEAATHALRWRAKPLDGQAYVFIGARL